MSQSLIIDMDEFLNNCLEKPQHFDIARILYTIKHEIYSCKYYNPNIWINKIDTSIPCEKVKENLISDIQSVVKDILIEYNKKLSVKSKKYKNSNKIIEKLAEEKYINKVIKEATEIFYNN